MIVIVNYKMGNLRSVQKALEKLGFSAIVSSHPEDVERAEKVIVPGVGAFGAAMRNLQEMELVEPIFQAIREGRPFLGICLGMQLLMEESEESEGIKGLSVFKGKAKRIRANVRVPHIGWNSLSIRKACPILKGIPDGEMFYFVHSFYLALQEEDIIVAETEHGERFPSVIHRDNVFGVQFHPEKSSFWGLRILRNFAELQC